MKEKNVTCYAPIFVMIASPFLLKEKLTLKKTLCVLGALIGMILISGVVQNKGINLLEMKGIFFGIGAAVFYASIIFLNKKIKNVSAYDKTIMQLANASLVLLPYALLTENFEKISVTNCNFTENKILTISPFGSIIIKNLTF